MSIADSRKSHFISPQAQSSSKVGHNIFAYCTRCKMNLTHTIVTVEANNKPNKVQCNTCRSERQYQQPKPEAGLKGNEGRSSMDRDEEQDLDLDAAARRLNMDDGLKRKTKAKGKIKKMKDDLEVKYQPKSSNTLPLSMLEGTAEDKAQYETFLLTQKNHLIHAKAYTPQQHYKVGEILDHKIFGIGFVVAESAVNKIEVLFSKGRKLLVMGLGAKK